MAGDMLVRLEDGIPETDIEQHGLGAGDFHQGCRRYAPGRGRRQQDRRVDIVTARRQHLRQEPAHGVTNQDAGAIQAIPEISQIGGVINQAGLPQFRRRLRLVVMAQTGDMHFIPLGAEFLGKAVQRPGRDKGAVNHHHRRLGCFPRRGLFLCGHDLCVRPRKAAITWA